MVIGFNMAEERAKLQNDVSQNTFLEDKEMTFEPYVRRESPSEFSLILPSKWKLGRFIKAVEGKKHFSLLKIM